MTIARLFETPVVVERIGAMAGLGEAILTRRAEDEGIQASNIGTWQSDRELLAWGGEGAATLARTAAALADTHTLDLKAGDAPRHKWGVQMWGNVSGDGDSTQFHCHPGALWAAVYYLATVAGQGGELVFRDPRYPKTRMAAPDFRFRPPGGEAESDESWIAPETGMLIMFPAWLEHAVRPCRGPGQRISIAINLSVVPL